MKIVLLMSLYAAGLSIPSFAQMNLWIVENDIEIAKRDSIEEQNYIHVSLRTKRIIMSRQTYPPSDNFDITLNRSLLTRQDFAMGNAKVKHCINDSMDVAVLTQQWSATDMAITTFKYESGYITNSFRERKITYTGVPNSDWYITSQDTVNYVRDMNGKIIISVIVYTSQATQTSKYMVAYENGLISHIAHYIGEGYSHTCKLNALWFMEYLKETGGVVQRVDTKKYKEQIKTIPKMISL